MTAKRVLLATILNGSQQVTMQHAIWNLSVQTALATMPDTSLQMTFQFFDAAETALEYFAHSDAVDTAVIVDATLAPQKEWLFECLAAGKKAVTGYYPLPGIEFDKIRDLQEAGCTDIEKLKRVGVRYNVGAFSEVGEGGWKMVALREGEDWTKNVNYTRCCYVEKGGAEGEGPWTNTARPVTASNKYAYVGSPGYRGLQIR